MEELLYIFVEIFYSIWENDLTKFPTYILLVIFPFWLIVWIIRGLKKG